MSDALKTLLEACGEVEGEIDRQCYDENRRVDFDAPDDMQYCINLTAKQIRALSRAASVLRERGGEEDYYPSHEALVDLVSLLGERDAIGGGPGFAERWKKAYDNACDLVRVEP